MASLLLSDRLLRKFYKWHPCENSNEKHSAIGFKGIYEFALLYCEFQVHDYWLSKLRLLLHPNYQIACFVLIVLKSFLYSWSGFISAAIVGFRCTNAFANDTLTYPTSNKSKKIKN